MNKTHKWVISKAEPDIIWREAFEKSNAIVKKFADKTPEWKALICNSDDWWGVLDRFIIRNHGHPIIEFLEANGIGTIVFNDSAIRKPQRLIECIEITYNDIVDDEYQWLQDTYSTVTAMDTFNKVLESYGIETSWIMCDLDENDIFGVAKRREQNT